MYPFPRTTGQETRKVCSVPQTTINQKATMESRTGYTRHVVKVVES